VNVNELFRRLSYGELSNLAISGEGSGTIVEAQRPKIVAHANEALLRLYSRFVLRESDLILELADFITSYHFLKRFAQSNDDPKPGDTLYIVDNVDEPFEEDLIKVLTVHNAIGERMPLNDVDNCYSMFTPQPNVLQVPNPVAGQIVGVGYQAKHEQLPYDDPEACIVLPVSLEGALTAYIAHKVFLNMQGAENSTKAAEHLSIYEGICQEVIAGDLVNSSSSSSGAKFCARGFV
jgi:hypothetical protein